MIKLFATDMDHTLLNDKSDLPNDFQSTLEALKKNDILFVLASGRTLNGMKNKVKDHSYNFTYISDNGAIIEHNNAVIYKSVIKNNDLDEIIDVLRTCEGASICASSIDAAYVEIHDPNHISYLHEYYPEFKIVDDLKAVDDEIIKITTLSMDRSDEIYISIVNPWIKRHGKCVALTSGKVWIDIMNKEVDKGNALKYLLNALNLHEDEVAAFGDYHNDIGMLKLAKYSYAVENAHADVKDIAKKIIANNNEAPVTSVINYFITNKKPY